MLQDNVTAALERNLVTNLNDSVARSLQRALLACNEEVVESKEISRVEMAQRNQQIDRTILNVLQSSNVPLGCRSEMDTLQTTWRIVPQLASQLDAISDPIIQEDELSAAFRRMCSQVKIW